MSPVKRRIVNSLARLACAEISQEVLKELRSKKKRKWVKEWVSKKENFGASYNLLWELALEDPARYMNVLRMDQAEFEELLALISPAIKKQGTVMRSSISCKTKLEITLRFLASGDSFRILGLRFSVPHNTISVFLPEVLHGIDGHDKPFCTTAITIIDNFKKALGDTDNQYISISSSDIDKLLPINFSDKCCGKFSMCLTKFFFCKTNCENVFVDFS